MTCTDANSVSPCRPVWKARLAMLFSILGAITLCLVARSLWSPGPATAQIPGFRSAAKTPAADKTAKKAPAAPRAGSPATQATAPAAAQTSNIVAVVNGQKITQEDLAREAVVRYGKDFLESIVNRQLIFQECQQRGIAITEDDVEAEVERVASKFGMPKDRWLQLLEQEREVRADQYRREIIWPTLALRRLASESISVSQEELQKAFESEYGPKVRIRLISVGTRAKAEQIHAKAVANPESFGDLAKEHSEDPNSASARGIVPPIRKHHSDPEIEKVAFGLKKGEVSSILEVANQFLIIRCEDQIEQTFVASQQLPAAREQLEDRLRDEKLRTAAGDIFRRLQDEAKVVNVMNDPKLQAQYPGVAALINGKPIQLSMVADECVTRHGKDVLDGEINRLILSQELQRRNKTINPQDIDEEIARAADAYGYLKKDGTPDTTAWLEAVTKTDHVSIDLYVKDAVWPSVALKKLVPQTIEISEEDLKRGFEANYGERVEALAIVLTNQRQAQQVWEMARGNPTDQFFGELAQQYSVEPISKANSGKVPPIRRHGGQPLVEDEAFRLKPGELSGIIAVADKYIILRCTGRTNPVVQDFNAVRDELARDIREKKVRVEMAKEFDRLKESAQVDNFLARTTQPGRKPTASRATGNSHVQPASGARPVAPQRAGSVVPATPPTKSQPVRR